MKKLFTFVFGVLFAMCANAVTLDIGEPNNNTEDAKANQVFFDTPSTISLGWNGDPDKGTVDVVKASLTDEAKSLLVPGNTLRIDYTKDPNEVYYQVQVMGAWWTILPSTKKNS